MPPSVWRHQISQTAAISRDGLPAAIARVLCGRTLPAAARDRCPQRQPAFCMAKSYSHSVYAHCHLTIFLVYKCTPFLTVLFL